MFRIVVMAIGGTAVGYLMGWAVMIVLMFIFIVVTRISLNPMPEWAWWVTQVVATGCALAFGLYSAKEEYREQQKVAPSESWKLVLCFLLLGGAWLLFSAVYRALVN